jgi:hypothetical protein
VSLSPGGGLASPSPWASASARGGDLLQAPLPRTRLRTSTPLMPRRQTALATAGGGQPLPSPWASARGGGPWRVPLLPRTPPRKIPALRLTALASAGDVPYSPSASERDGGRRRQRRHHRLQALRPARVAQQLLPQQQEREQGRPRCPPATPRQRSG